MHITKKLFKKKILNFSPFKWTYVKNHPNNNLNGNHQLLINFNRFYLITKYFFKYIKNNQTVFDIGTYPGTTVKLLQELSKEYNLNIIFEGLGLNLNKQFQNTMKKIGIKLYDFDLEKLNKRNKIPKISHNKYDHVLLTDVIEHISNPFDLFEEMHRILKLNGKLIITTDNVSRIELILEMLKGRSPNIPILESNFFYGGDWRPHFREYDKLELIKFAKWNGFKLLDHLYYDAEFGEYKIIDGKIKKNFININLINLIYRVLRKMISHYKDNQIFVFEKIDNNINYLSRPYFTNNQKIWNNLRKKFSN